MRKENGRKNRIRNAKFPYKKFLDTLAMDDLPTDAKAKFKELESLKFIEENRNIIFCPGGSVFGWYVGQFSVDKNTLFYSKK